MEKKPGDKKEIENRSLVLWMLAGAYLIYTGYQLCRNVLNEAQGASWGFMAAGIVFALVGVVLLIMSVRGFAAKGKKKEDGGAEETSQENASETSKEESGEENEQESEE